MNESNLCSAHYLQARLSRDIACKATGVPARGRVLVVRLLVSITNYGRSLSACSTLHISTTLRTYLLRANWYFTK